MPDVITNLPWAAILPMLAMTAFFIGLVVKTAQDKTVVAVKKLTIRPGELNTGDLQAYLGRRAQGHQSSVN